jgi:hypothetical protein
MLWLQGCEHSSINLKKERLAYIWMVSDLLDDLIIEVAGVSQEVASDVVCVLYTLEDICGNWELRSLSKLGTLILSGQVDVLHPAVMCGSG